MRCDYCGSPIRGEAEYWIRDSANVWHPFCRWQCYVHYDDRQMAQRKKAPPAKVDEDKHQQAA
jgi:hypothetical protein